MPRRHEHPHDRRARSRRARCTAAASAAERPSRWSGTASAKAASSRHRVSARRRAGEREPPATASRVTRPSARPLAVDAQQRIDAVLEEQRRDAAQVVARLHARQPLVARLRRGQRRSSRRRGCGAGASACGRVPTKPATKSLAGRASSSSGAAYCSSLPARKIAMRSAIFTASSMSWLTNSTVLRSDFCMRRNSSWITSRLTGSTAPNGSSISSTGGSAASARATPTRCAWPPDSSPG